MHIDNWDRKSYGSIGLGIMGGVDLVGQLFAIHDYETEGMTRGEAKERKVLEEPNECVRKRKVKRWWWC